MEGIKISMFTAKVYPEIEMDEFKKYIIDYLTKPFDTNEIVRTVNSYFKTSEGSS